MYLNTFISKIRKNRVAGLTFAFLLIALAVTLRITSPITLSYVTFYPAIILATIAGGWLLGLTAMLVSTIAAIYFFVSPTSLFNVAASDIWNAIAFWVVCLVIILLTNRLVELLLHSNERAEKLHSLYEKLAQSEKQQQYLMRELAHRMKNQYSVILAMARASEGSSANVKEYQSAFSDRLRSMARAHDLLTSKGGEAVSLRALVKSELEPFWEKGRIEIEGVDTRLKEHAVVYVGMALHELATNSAKHGAWSGANGKVSISWALSQNHLTFVWQEVDGPTVSQGERRGFGRMILEKIVPASLEGQAELEFAARGLKWSLSLPVGCVELEPASEAT